MNAQSETPIITRRMAMLGIGFHALIIVGVIAVHAGHVSNHHDVHGAQAEHTRSEHHR